NSFMLATASLLIGSHVLKFFALSLPAVQIGGGLVVAATGWPLLNRGEEEAKARAPAASAEAVMAGSFYPLTMPLTVGPGSIAIMLTVGSSAPNALGHSRALLLEAGGGLAAVALVSWSIYLSYRYADQILAKLGPSGINVLLRLSAFFLLCLGVQILFNGYRAITSASGG